ncbi:hypothetical protein C8Q77DRAFT_1094637 [Trametes polyzona]|nr:hypothetical protein C8Q77DRAFT_1094637 [Trametes polyzona]
MYAAAARAAYETSMSARTSPADHTSAQQPHDRDPAGGRTAATMIKSALSELCVRVLSLLCVPLVLRCLAVWQGVAARAHELLCRLFAVAPCQAYEPRQSAVVIVNGSDDDVGRRLALDFSELGYAVFALCPDTQAVSPSESEPLRDASNVSSLIQEWHKRIKRSGRSPWGLLAPIVLDMNSGTQRTHAVETVDAYCATHNLRLVAVIVLPTPAPAPPRPLVGDAADVSAWAEIVRQCLVAPISVVHDYSNLLAAASGRVVLLLASGDQVGMRSAHLRTLESAAHLLREHLGLLGIRVSTVSTGPFAPAAKPSTHMVNVARPGAGALASSGQAGDRGPTVRSVIREVLQPFFVRYEDVWRTVYDIARSR